MDAKSLQRMRSERKALLGRFSDCFEYQAEGFLATSVRGLLSDLARNSVEPMALRAGVPVRSWQAQRVRKRVQEIVAAEHTAKVAIGLMG